MKKVFAEMGIGNRTLFSTEIEEALHEYRIPRFVRPGHINDVYLRLWIGNRVLVLSAKDGVKITIKPRRAFKLLVGVGGLE